MRGQGRRRSHRLRRRGVEKRWVVVYASDGRGVGDGTAVVADVQKVVVGGKEFSSFSDGGCGVLGRGVSHDVFSTVQRAVQSRDLRILPVIFESADDRAISHDTRFNITNHGWKREARGRPTVRSMSAPRFAEPAT